MLIATSTSTKTTTKTTINTSFIQIFFWQGLSEHFFVFTQYTIGERHKNGKTKLFGWLRPKLITQFAFNTTHQPNFWGTSRHIDVWYATSDQANVKKNKEQIWVTLTPTHPTKLNQGKHKISQGKK
jgi:hypothetical protein